MKSDEEIIESLVAGGLIGAALGALISKSKGEGAALGALIGAAILGTYKANEKAKETHIPMVMEENGNLYQINADGSKQFIKVIEKSNVKFEKAFKLK
jgi:Glycine zipper